MTLHLDADEKNKCIEKIEKAEEVLRDLKQIFSGTLTGDGEIEIEIEPATEDTNK